MSEITSLQIVIKDLQKQVAAMEAENTDSKREAESLAMALWRRHYREISPDFELCDSTAGVITQIDNMSAGLSAKAEKLEAQVAALEAENTRLNAVLDSIWTRCYEFIANEINDQQFIQETGEYARTRGVDE